MEKQFNIKDLNISIIGLGLVGGSYAKAFRGLKPKNLWAVDIDREALKKADDMGLINKGFTDAKGALKDSDLVIICLYPKLLKAFMRENKDYFKKGSIITDVTGIKNGVIEEVSPFIPEDVDFIFGHPMAGREKKGLDYSSAEVFQGANYIITPTKDNKEENIQMVEDMARAIGFKNVMRISPEKHDEIISFTSQLPHVIAVSLINSDDLNVHTGSYVGDSYRDLTRIADLNEELWSQLFIGNKDNLIQKIEVFQEKIQILKDAIENEESHILHGEFIESSKRKRKLIGDE